MTETVEEIELTTIKSPKRSRKRGKASMDNTDVILGMEVDPRIERMVTIHSISNRHHHRVTIDTAKRMLDVMSKGTIPCRVVRYSEGYMEYLLTSKCPCLIAERDPTNKIVGQTTTACDFDFIVSEFYVRVVNTIKKENRQEFEEILERLTILKTRLIREARKTEYNWTDCPVCINPSISDGFGKKYSMTYGGTYLHKCFTCQSIYCPHCKVATGLVQRLDHTNVSCVAYQQLKQTLGEETFISCPKCNTYVVKIDGCNHITCWCRTEFCYICGEQIDATFSHFRNNPRCKQFDRHYERSFLEFQNTPIERFVRLYQRIRRLFSCRRPVDE